MREKTDRAQSAWARYVMAVLAVGACFGLRWALPELIGSAPSYIAFVPAVIFAARFGGLGPAILAAAFSLAIASADRNLPLSVNLIGGIVFVGAFVFIGVLGELLRRARSRSEESAAELAKAKRDTELSRDLLDATLASIGDAVITTDSQARVTFLNDVAQELTGWSQSEAEGKPAAEVFRIQHEDSGLAAESPVDRVIREGAVVGLANHTMLLSKSGKTLPIEDSAAPILGAKRKPYGVVLVFRDVTARRAIENVHQVIEDRLTLALEAGQIGVWDWDVVQDKVEWSDLIFEIHGVAKGEFAGTVEAFARLVHPEDGERVNNAISAALERDAPYQIEFRIVQGSGSVRWVSATAKVFRDEDGRAIRMLGSVMDITARKEAESDLRQQWQSFDKALSNTADFVYTFDLQGRFTYVNQALLSRWGRTLGEAVGKNPLELGYPEELAGRWQRQIQQVIDTKKALRDQTPYPGAMGELGFYEYIFVPVFGADGRVEAVAGSTRDITLRMQAAQQIEEDRRRWRELLEQAPAGIAVLRGPEHRFEWVNSYLARLIGRPLGAVETKPVLEALPELGGQIYIDLLSSVYRTGEPYVGRETLLRLERREGELEDLYVNFVCLATRDVEGEIDGVFFHATDVTEMVISRKLVEESERQFRTLAETIPHLTWMADETGHIFWYNQRWYEYTATNLEEMGGWGWQKVHDPEVLPDVLREWRGSLVSGEPFEMVFPLRGKDGTFRSFLTRVEPVRNNRGAVVRWFGTNTDITDQRRTEEELRRTNRELEEFAYVASHDLQEPLRMVNIYTQLIVGERGGEEGELGQYCGFVQQGVTRMQSLIQDLLTFSRTVHNVREVPVGEADLNLSLNEAIGVLRDRIEESGSAIVRQPLPKVKGDLWQLAHVFQNLLSNAMKYQKKEAPPQIEISAERSGGHWIISVEDTGIGFEQQYAVRIFGLFKRLHSNNAEYPGTGLGLAICKRIVERYGGRIWAEGKPGEGAVFRFSLPAADVE